ncbi:MAG: hypothetical protein JXB07_18330 [Anaerolineae bacterium]|nr:hypothetical protein [Anaerolineae bacterium]
MMPFKPIRALLAALMLLLFVGCEGAFSFMPESTPTPSPTATSTPPHTPAPTSTLTPSPVPRKLILGCTPSPDGRWLAVVDDLGVRVYETASYSEVWRAPVTGILEDLQRNWVQIAWADDSTAFIVSISQEVYVPVVRDVSHLSRFDAASGKLLWQQSFEDHHGVAFAPDGNHFLLISIYRDLGELWDGSVPERTGTLELPQYATLEWPRTGNWSPDGTLLAGKLAIGSPTQAVEIIEGVISLSSDGPTREPGIFVWDTVTGKLITKLRDSRQGTYSTNLGWSPDGSYLISDENGRFILWNTETWRFQSQIVYDEPFKWASIDLSPDGTKLMSLLYYNTFEGNDIRFAIHAWEMPSGKHLPAASGALLASSNTTSFDFVGWLPDRSSFLYQVDERIVTLDTSQGQIGEPFPIPQASKAWETLPSFDIDYYQLSPDGKHIYFVEPQAVVVYDEQTGEVIAELVD